MADAETFARIKKRWESLTDEQRQEVVEILKAQRPSEPERSPYFAGGEKPIPRPEPIPGYPANPENPYADATAGAMGTAAAVLPAAAGVAGAASLSGAAAQLARLAGRAAIGAGGGAAVGSMPVVGMGAKEGAHLGAMLSLGQKGTGALWKHGKRKALIEWILRKLTGEADEAAGATAARTAGRAGKAAGRAVGRAAPKLPKRLSQEQRNLIKQLQGLARTSSANREAVKKTAQEVFGDDWRKVWKWIEAPQTRL